jgi:hypothetical protein
MNEIDGYSSVTAQERAELTALCTEYAWRADNYLSDRIPDLFLQDGTWEGTGTFMKGRKELVAGWKARALLGKEIVRRHMISNLRFARAADGVIHGWVTFSFLKRPIPDNAAPSWELVGEWIDSYGQDASGKWLFRTRKVEFLFPHDWSLPTPKLPD